jgi:hypothetical protein
VVFLLDLHVFLGEGGCQFCLFLQLLVLLPQSGHLGLHFLVGFDVAEHLVEGLLVVVAETTLQFLETAPQVHGGLVLQLLLWRFQLGKSFFWLLHLLLALG